MWITFWYQSYVSFPNFKFLELSEVIRAEAETLFSVLLKMQIHHLMLLLFLMKFSNLVLIKVETNPNIMLSQTFAQIRNLSNQLPDPAGADRAMHQLLCTNVKLKINILVLTKVQSIPNTK